MYRPVDGAHGCSPKNVPKLQNFKALNPFKHKYKHERQTAAYFLHPKWNSQQSPARLPCRRVLLFSRPTDGFTQRVVVQTKMAPFVLESQVVPPPLHSVALQQLCAMYYFEADYFVPQYVNRKFTKQCSSVFLPTLRKQAAHPATPGRERLGLHILEIIKHQQDNMRVSSNQKTEHEEIEKKKGKKRPCAQQPPT